VLVVNRFIVDDESAFVPRAEAALTALAGRPGYLSGGFGRSVDEPERWCLVTRWESVGSYRRALSAFEVKIEATPLLAESLDEPSAYEVLLSAEPGGPVCAASSDRAAAPPALPSQP
jgi:heme oxygenase (mycobilin-producing)